MDQKSVLNNFHPIIKEWFTVNIGVPSLPQVLGWPEIQAGNNVLISAPTGAGKTLAAFLESIDCLLKSGLDGALPDGVFILYVSPLKALNNDIYKNLDIPLEGIKKYCMDAGIAFPDIKKAVRTGDTPQNERHKMLKNPPHILITTPESLYLMLTSKKSIELLKKVRYLIVDEIHTMLGTKRGVHLAVSIERLQNLTEHELIRIGLSATVNPVEAAAAYLGGMKKAGESYEKRPVTIIAPDMERNKELKIHMPVADYRVLEQGTIWPEIYDSVLKLIKEHTSTIVFVNNRAVAEKVAANVNALADEEICRPHHGSISKGKRLEVEEKFKNGELKCMIATSTLELGIDIGSVDLMIQVAAPISVSSGLQRLGRAGHRLNATSKGYIIPKTRLDLVKSAFIAKEMLEGHIEQEKIPLNCLDILAQHVVSMCCQRKWTEDGMLDVIRSTWSYRDIKESDFKKVLAMLAGDFEHMEDIPAKPRIYWDRQNRTIEGTGYSRMLAVSSSGTIPDRGYFAAVLEDHKTRIGELDEVFVFEARLGDRFILGNSAWKIVKIEKNRVIVTPGSSTGAKTPFWQGDGIGCPYEQGISYGRFIKELSAKLDSGDFSSFLTDSKIMDDTAALNIKNYLMDQREALGFISHDRLIAVEYLKDEVADQRIIVHAHFGDRVNSVLAILLQKAIEETIHCQVFSSHSNDAVLIHIYGCPDPILNLFSQLSPSNVENVLLEMLPSTSRFAMTFRYNAYRSLMMGVRNLGQRLPLWIQRLRSVDALENARKYLDHPLLIETMRECLEEIFDIPNTIKVLNDIKSGRIEVVEKNMWFPSPFASELLFEFKAEMMYLEKDSHPGDTKSPVVSGIDALNLSYHRDEAASPVNPEAVREVCMKNNALSKLQDIASPNELHSFLLIYGDITALEVPSGIIQEWFTQLLEQKQVLLLNDTDKYTGMYIAVEEKELYSCAYGKAGEPEDGWIEGVTGGDSGDALDTGNDLHLSNNHVMGEANGTWTKEDAILRIIRRFSRYHSPFTLEDLQTRYGFDGKIIEQMLYKQKSDGLLTKGHFTHPNKDEFCHIRVYEAIVRKESSLKSNEVIAQSPSAYAAFLPYWQRIGTETADREAALYEVISQMEGLYLPVDWWENIVFPARIEGYSPAHLDRLCTSGRVLWRISSDNVDKNLSLAWYCIENLTPDLEPAPEPEMQLSDRAVNILQILKQRGACFTHVLAALAGIKTSELLDILKEFVYKGLVVNDSFTPIRYFTGGNNSSRPASDINEEQKARKIALTVSRMNMGRWEIAWPIPDSDLPRLIDRWFLRYGLLTRDSLSMEKTPVSWNDTYNALKLREYAGNVLRGYFISGISGIQFMLPDACHKLGLPVGLQVINACDPAQVYGKLIPHSESPLPFINLPGTVIVMDSGKPVIVLERFGEKISFTCGTMELTNALQAFKNSFIKKQVWPDRKKVVVKYWPEDDMERERLQKALYDTGFRNDVMKMVLWR